MDAAKLNVSERLSGGEIYSFGNREAREKSAAFLFAYAKAERASQEEKWARYDDYYAGRHGSAGALSQDGAAVPFAPATVPDAWIHVESQVIPEIPDFQFRGRDRDLDSSKAKQREYAVKYVIENNRVADKNTANERRLLKYGDAFWKVRWDSTRFFPGSACGGDIAIDDVDPAEIYPDPTARSLQDGEFLIHTYGMHRRKVARLYAADLHRAGLTLEMVTEEAGGFSESEIYNGDTLPRTEDCVRVTEFYYRTADDRVGLSILLNGREVRHVADFWERTGRQNKNFPFVHYWRIKNENSFWNTSELEPVIPLIDAADRELAVTMLNRAFMANDIIVMEEDALSEGAELCNEPGAVVSVRPGKLSSLQRLSGHTSSDEGVAMVEKYTEMIERAVGNFDSSMGREPLRVTTASGIAQLNERADARKSIKNVDRILGFERLFTLVDWFCLEFYDDNRLIFLGAGQGRKEEGPVAFRYNADAYLVRDGAMGEYAYFPGVDCVVTAGDGTRKSRAFTMSVLESLLKTEITRENFRIVCALIEQADIPQGREIIDDILSRYGDAPKESEKEKE